MLGKLILISAWLRPSFLCSLEHPSFPVDALCTQVPRALRGLRPGGSYMEDRVTRKLCYFEEDS